MSENRPSLTLSADIGAAWNAGLDGIHVQRGSPISEDRCVWGDHRVTSLRDL